jgi:hypothetical protein
MVRLPVEKKSREQARRGQAAVRRAAFLREDDLNQVRRDFLSRRVSV